MLKPNLDLLRALAVLLVLAAHIAGYTIRTTPVSFALGQLGVMLFFVHTSLVLMQSLERQQLSGAALLRSFYLQRACRIYPLAAVLLLGIYCFADGQWTPFELAANLLLVQNLVYARYMSVVLWTLCLEVQMYLLLPLLFLLFRRRPLRWLLALWLLSIPLALVQPLVTARLSLFEFAPCFLAGVLAWRMQGRQRLPGWLWPPLLALACAAFVVYAEPRANNYGRWLVCLAVGLALPWVRELAAPPLNRASKFIAKYSYGIYLFHPPLMGLAFRTLEALHPVWQWSLFLSLLVLLTGLGYHLVELPMIRLGARWSAARAGAGVAAPAG
ncbi:Peptidoglycan/LPS O-acetylase OafA/YrhL, contains acyltransferase and SGNH-hydrolase domains [Duganella sp. CF458]|nr:Peptidoglycan/LPS O-acetylase OafA/YrhL, contains acyltransferase and SGNH-hydrolase domains [Duganella sp. CF458]